MRRELLLSLVLSVLLFATPFAATQSELEAIHGMLLIGEETVYVSHLPMFTAPPHRYQAILEVTFAAEEGTPHDEYVRDRRESGESLYTLVPHNRFVFPELISTTAEQPARQSFPASIYRGHFERGGVEILDVVVTVTRTVHFHELDPDAEALLELEYFLFGKGQELFLAHLITGPPDFDQLLAVKQIDQDFSDEELAEGVRITFPNSEPMLMNSIADRLNANQRIMANNNLTIETGEEIFFEESELRVPDFFGQTQAEMRAGF